MNAQISEGWTRGLAVSPDGRYIASVDRSEGGIFEVSGSTLCRIPELELRGEFVCFDRDGAQLVVLRRDDVAEIRSAPAWKVAREIPDAEAHFAVVRGEHLIFAAAYPQKGLKLLHLATDEAPRTFGSESIRAFDISPDGTQLAGIAMLPKAFPKIPCALEMWSYPEGRLLWSRELDQEGLAIAYAPDGSLVLGSKGGLSIWKPGEQEPSVRVTHEAAIQSIAFHPGGRRMATNDSDGSVRLWDVPSYRPIVELARHEGAGFRMAWSSDGSMLVSGGKDGMLFALDGR